MDQLQNQIRILQLDKEELDRKLYQRDLTINGMKSHMKGFIEFRKIYIDAFGHNEDANEFTDRYLDINDDYEVHVEIIKDENGFKFLIQGHRLDEEQCKNINRIYALFNSMCDQLRKI